MADLAASGSEPRRGRQARHRVIGTPSPAQARTLLAPARTSGPAAGPRAARRPGGPARRQAGRAGRRGLLHRSPCWPASASSPCYVIFRVHTVNNVFALQPGPRPAPWPSPSWRWASAPSSGSGTLMPNVELTEQRHPLRSTPENQAAFAKTFEEGADASQFVKRPMLRRTLIAATVPRGHRPDRAAARPRAAAREEPGPHRLEARHPAGRVRHQPAADPGRVQHARLHRSASSPRATPTTTTPWPRPRPP